MSEHVNITAYDGVENLSRFTDESFKKYCDDKLSSCNKYIAFIKNNLPPGKLNVLEIGSGNGKLLFRMEKDGILERGVGFEVSKSRTLFADKFSEYVNSKNVTFYNEDYLGADLKGEKFDLIIGIDVVINMIGAITSEHVNRFITKTLEHLKPGGVLLFEYMTLKREIAFVNNSENGVYRTWKKFADSDPFKYGLDEISWDESKNLLWNKYFISRSNGNEEKSSSIWKPLNKKDFMKLTDRYGLTASFFDFWDISDDTLDEEYITLLRRK